MTACAVHFCLQATAGTLQSLCWASSAVGGIVSAYFSGSLVQDYGTHAVFGFTAVFPLIVSASALLIDEQRVTASPALAMTAATAAEDGRGLSEGAAAGNSSSSSWTGDIGSRMLVQAGALWGAVKQKHILLPTIFLFLWQVRGVLIFQCSITAALWLPRYLTTTLVAVGCLG